MLWRKCVSATLIRLWLWALPILLVACGGGGGEVAGLAVAEAQILTVKSATPDQFMQTASGIEIVKSQLIVVTADTLSPADAVAMFTKAGATVVGQISVAHIYQLEVSGATDESALVKVQTELTAQTGVSQVTFNTVSSTNAVASSEWLPSGGRYKDQLWAIDQINGESAWQQVAESKKLLTKGVKVGIVDSGFSVNHGDIEFAKVYGPAGEENSSSAQPPKIPGAIDDLASYFKAWKLRHHGMHVAGIIGANGLNQVGTAGVAWQGVPLIYAARTDLTDMSNLVHIARLVHEGCKVINLSLGRNLNTKIEPQKRYEISREMAITYGTIIQSLAKDNDFLVVLAAGNDVINADEGSLLGYLFRPNSNIYDKFSVARSHSIIVGATGGDGSLNEDSNYGAGVVEVLAPGGDRPIAGTTAVDGLPRYYKQDKPKQTESLGVVSLGAESGSTTIMNGTSMAAPHVTGAAALAWAINPSLSAAQVKQMLISSGKTVSRVPGESYPLLDLNSVVKKAYSATGVAAVPVGDTTATIITTVVCRSPFLADQPLTNVPVQITPSSSSGTLVGGASLTTGDAGVHVAELPMSLVNFYGTDTFRVRVGPTVAGLYSGSSFKFPAESTGLVRRVNVVVTSNSSDCNSLDATISTEITAAGTIVESLPITPIEVLRSGLYEADFGKDCYQKMTVGNAIGVNEYPVIETRWCMSNGVWTQQSDGDPALTMLPTGIWVPSNQATLLFSDDSTFRTKYGNFEFEVGTFKLLTPGASYPIGSAWFTVNTKLTRDKFQTFSNESQMYVYKNSPTISAMIQTWSVDNNGHARDYLISHNGYGYAFKGTGFEASGIVNYYDLTKDPVCNASGCTRDWAYQSTWVRRTDMPGNDAIELRTPTGLQDADLSGQMQAKVIYVRRPAFAASAASTGDTGVRQGVRVENGSTNSFAGYNKIHFDAILQENGFPKAAN